MKSNFWSKQNIPDASLITGTLSPALIITNHGFETPKIINIQTRFNFYWIYLLT
eukprot:UN00707